MLFSIQYLPLWILGILFSALSNVSGSANSTFANSASTLFAWLWLATVVLAIFPAVKRLHDLGHSGWWYLAVQVVPILAVLLLGLVGSMVAPGEQAMSETGVTWMVVLIVLSILPGLGLTIYMFFWRGTVGPNRYGPDPLERGQGQPLHTGLGGAPHSSFTPAAHAQPTYYPQHQASPSAAPVRVHTPNTSPVSQPMPTSAPPNPASASVAEIDEEAIYEQVANEIDSGNVRKGLWTKLWAELDGDDAKVKLAYVKTRVVETRAEKIELEARRLAELKEKAIEDARRALETGAVSVREQLDAIKILPKEEISELKMGVLRNGVHSTYWKAIQFGDMPTVQALAASNPVLLLFVDSDGNNPLRIAVQGGNVEPAKFLLDCGVDPDKKNNYGVSARDQLAKNGTTEMVAIFPRKI